VCEMVCVGVCLCVITRVCWSLLVFECVCVGVYWFVSECVFEFIGVVMRVCCGLLVCECVCVGVC